MTTKIAVSLPDEHVASARRAVHEGRAASVSGYIAEAVSEHERRGALAELLAEMDAEVGPPSPEDFAWARSALGMA